MSRLSPFVLAALKLTTHATDGTSEYKTLNFCQIRLILVCAYKNFYLNLKNHQELS